MLLPQCCGRVPMGRAPSLPKKGRDGCSFKCFVFNHKSAPMSCLQWLDAVETIWMAQYQCKHGVACGVHCISYACLRKDVFGEILLKVSYSDTHSAWGCASQTPHAKVTLVWVFIRVNLDPIQEIGPKVRDGHCVRMHKECVPVSVFYANACESGKKVNVFECRVF